MDLWLNTLALLFGMAGTVLIYFYGIPRQIDTGGRSRLLRAEVDEGEKLRITRSNA
jgi:hypothetical protein